MLDAQLVAFVGVAVVVTLTPGPDMALVLRNTLRGGRGDGLRTVAGIAVGLAVWATASALGVAAVLAASATVFTALKLIGAVYLVYLGVQSLRAAWTAKPHDDAQPDVPQRRAGSPFRDGLVTNLLNPKLAVQFTTLLPQFISPDDPPVVKSVLLVAIFLSIGLTWLVTYVHLVHVVARSRAFRRAAEAVAGVVLVGLGVRLAVER